MTTKYNLVLWCAGLHWEDSRVSYAAQHIASCSYCTRTVCPCNVWAYRNSAWTYGHTREFSYTQQSWVFSVCCWLVCRCLVLCCPTMKLNVAALFCDTIWWGLVFPLQKASTRHTEQHLLCVFHVWFFSSTFRTGDVWGIWVVLCFSCPGFWPSKAV